jgi:hypothetical protein
MIGLSFFLVRERQKLRQRSEGTSRHMSKDTSEIAVEF